MKNYKFIIFAGDHYNTLGLLRSLAEQYYQPVLILLTDVIKPCLVNHSRYCKDVFYVKTLDEALNLLLSTFADENNPPFILTGIDRIETFLDQNYDLLKDKFYFFNAGMQGSVTKLMGKYFQEKLAASCGMNIIKSEVLKNGEFPSTLKYPVLTKAVDSRAVGWKDMMHICNNEYELAEAYKKIEAHEILVQEFIQKDNEIAISGCAFNNGKTVVCPFKNKHIRITKESYGTYFNVDLFDDVHLKNKITKFFAKANYNGIFEIEFILGKDKELYFLETNFRASAFVYAFTRAGFQIPLMWAEGEKTGLINHSLINISNVPVSVMVGPSEFSKFVLSKKISIWQWLKELKDCDVLFYYNRKDWLPFLYMIWDKMKLHIFHI